MITSLHLKNKFFDSNLIQGPLAGYSCAPLRLLAQQWGQPAFCYSEMLSAKNLSASVRVALRYSFKDPNEGPLCIQLSGNDPDDLSRAADRALAFGADLLDLNCGCPVAKIRKKGAGSKLLDNPTQLTALIHAMQRDANIPVSIKLRVDNDIKNDVSITAALIAQDAGVDFITVHGRHWTESYDTPCRVDQIARIVDALSIPVIANGDVADTQSALKLLSDTHAAGLMIARASVGRPWLFTQIKAEAQGQLFTPPSSADIGQLFLQHVQGLIALEGEKIAVLQARKLIKYYARSLENRTEIMRDVNEVMTYEQLTKLIAKHFESQTISPLFRRIL